MGREINEMDKLQMIQLVRQMTRERGEEWDGTLEQAIRGADQYTKTYHIEAMVIRRKNKYDWVTPHFFDTYTYKGKIYHTTKVDLDE